MEAAALVGQPMLVGIIMRDGICIEYVRTCIKYLRTPFSDVKEMLFKETSPQNKVTMEKWTFKWSGGYGSISIGFVAKIRA